MGIVATVAVTACTKPNPRSCVDEICEDPDLPFCDVDGSFAGEPMTCIAVACTPGEFAACRGDLEIACNNGGTNYDLARCERGCDPAALGCRLCSPNETVCQNGKAQTCDANGAVISSVACPLGCFADQPRCTGIAPSNNLASYLDLIAAPPDLVLPSGSINTATGVIRDANNTSISIPSFLAAAAGGGADIRVFVVDRAQLGNVSITSTSADGITGPALAILAKNDIIVDGRIAVDGVAGCVPSAACNGGQGRVQAGSQTLSTGSGGGGAATIGAAGGGLPIPLNGGDGGGVDGSAALVPLRGGCPSGGIVGGPMYGVPGGGAIQLSSETKILVSGVIDAEGQPGLFIQASGAIYGGGAGGSILLEAPVVELGQDARLLAKGGGGAANGTDPVRVDTANPNPGATCMTASMYCGDGGDGAAPAVPAQPGTAAMAADASGPSFISGGGGGGGLGRVRINTRDGVYNKASTALEAAVVTTGVIGTR